MMRFPTNSSLLLVAGAAAFAMLPGGCGNSGGGEARVIAIGSQPKVRDPAQGTLTPGDRILLQSVAQGLVAFDDSGNIVGGLAERWNVSDDGLSYIFRLAPAKWSDGRKVTAEQVARTLRRQVTAGPGNPLHDALGAVQEIVAMTDRVLEIRLAAPRPNLLALLAQPELAILRGGLGTGPFTLTPKLDKDGWMLLEREVIAGEDESVSHERVRLKGEVAEAALAAFAGGEADLVLGGTFADLSLAQRSNAPRSALRFDPASGLFGLVPLRSDGPAGRAAVRALLNRTLDRDALIAALGVRGLVARTTLLEPGLDGHVAPVAPPWAATPIADRRAAAVQEAKNLIGKGEQTRIRIFLPHGPGADLLFHQLEIDWGSLGFAVERSDRQSSADFALLDSVAPSLSPAWYVRRFHCTNAQVCDPQVDALLDSARVTLTASQRYALIAQAAARADDDVLFIPIAAPIRWSMVNTKLAGFALNRFARHSLIGLRQVRR